MADTLTANLLLRCRAIGSPLPGPPNNWGNTLNSELERLDAAIGDVCTPIQVARLKAVVAGFKILGPGIDSLRNNP